jgi:precorrin-2/cobalt-factor-2 C20-methyltransferase
MPKYNKKMNDTHGTNMSSIRKGKLYGIGIGPGDPELITLKAKRILDSVGTIFVPVKNMSESSTALSIVSKVIDLTGKNIVKVLFSMEGGREDFLAYGKEASSVIIRTLDPGNDAAMITLGDVSIYSTYMYLNGYIENEGYDTEIVPGVTSFSCSAALAKVPLMLGDEGLAVIPSLKNRKMAEAAMDNFDNVVVMKSGKSMDGIAEMMIERGIPRENAVVISRAGMDGQYIGPLMDGKEFNYFTTTIVKKVMK